MPDVNPAHSQDGQIGRDPRPLEATRVTPTAATSTSPIMPIARSASTTVAASVFERVTFALSATRTTSPPMLLGRKLLKNSATDIDANSDRNDMSTSCASSSSLQRHTLATTLSV